MRKMSKNQKRKNEDSFRIEVSAASLDENGPAMVNIPDPGSPSGFSKGYKAEKILGATKVNNEILLLIKW